MNLPKGEIQTNSMGNIEVLGLPKFRSNPRWYFKEAQIGINEIFNCSQAFLMCLLTLESKHFYA